MRHTYEAIFTEDTEAGGFTVNFPDLAGCFTEGDSFQEATEMAADVLALHLGANEFDALHNEPPVFGHSVQNGEQRVLISVETDLKALGVTTTEAARRLGVSIGRVQQLVANGELASLKLGRDRFVSALSIQDRLKKPRKAGRPKKVAIA